MELGALARTISCYRKRIVSNPQRELGWRSSGPRKILRSSVFGSLGAFRFFFFQQRGFLPLEAGIEPVWMQAVT